MEGEDDIIFSYIGAALNSLDEFKDAIEMFDKSLEINPKNEDALNDKGIALSCLGKEEEAIKCYEKILKINPKDLDAWINKGISLGKLERHKEAIDCYNNINNVFDWIFSFTECQHSR